jgi:hypothetical protein
LQKENSPNQPLNSIFLACKIILIVGFRASFLIHTNLLFKSKIQKNNEKLKIKENPDKCSRKTGFEHHTHKADRRTLIFCSDSYDGFTSFMLLHMLLVVDAVVLHVVVEIDVVETLETLAVECTGIMNFLMSC